MSQELGGLRRWESTAVDKNHLINEKTFSRRESRQAEELGQKSQADVEMCRGSVALKHENKLSVDGVSNNGVSNVSSPGNWWM